MLTFLKVNKIYDFERNTHMTQMISRKSINKGQISNTKIKKFSKHF